MGEFLEIAKLGGLNAVTWLLLLYLLQELKRAREEVLVIKLQIEKDLDSRFSDLNKSLEYRYKVHEDEIREIKSDIRDLYTKYNGLLRA